MRRLALTALLLLAGCVTAQAEKISKADLARLTLADRFERHAFADEVGHESPVTRWFEAPRLALFGDVDRLARIGTNFDGVATSIGAATGLVISRDDERPTVFLALGDEQELRRQILSLPKMKEAYRMPINCGGYTWNDLGSRHTIAAVILIRAELPDDEIRACLAQETVQVMGLLADIDGAGDTVMDSTSTHTRLTPIDKRLLAILYDPRLKPGMRRAEAMPIVRAIIAEKGW